MTKSIIVLIELEIDSLSEIYQGKLARLVLGYTTAVVSVKGSLRDNISYLATHPEC